MHISNRLRLFCSAAAVTFATFGSAAAFAQSPPDAVIDLPAGLACAGFDLRIEVRGAVQQNRLFTDKSGNPVRFVSVGKGSALSLINLNNGNSIALRPNGSGTHIQFNPDGTQTLSATGHNLIILFPTDLPAGPSTIQYVGRVLLTISADGNSMFTFRQVSGTRTDICAALV
jgi:WD40 repeat protein